MGNCRDCRWWTKGVGGTLMYCDRVDGIEFGEAPVFVGIENCGCCNVSLVTAPDFGCVQFEAKEV